MAFDFDDREALYTELGRFALAWSEMEFGLDLLVLVCREDEKRVPIDLKGKVHFISAAAKNLNRLAPLASAITAVAKDISKASVERHDYVHGAVIDFVGSQGPLAVRLSRILQPKGPRRAPVLVTSKLLGEAVLRTRLLGDRTLELADTVNQLPVNRRTDNISCAKRPIP